MSKYYQSTVHEPYQSPVRWKKIVGRFQCTLSDRVTFSIGFCCDVDIALAKLRRKSCPSGTTMNDPSATLLVLMKRDPVNVILTGVSAEYLNHGPL